MGQHTDVKYFGHKDTEAIPLGANLTEARFYAKLFGYKRCRKCGEFVVKDKGICPVCKRKAIDGKE